MWVYYKYIPGTANVIVAAVACLDQRVGRGVPPFTATYAHARTTLDARHKNGSCILYINIKSKKFFIFPDRLVKTGATSFLFFFPPHL